MSDVRTGLVVAMSAWLVACGPEPVMNPHDAGPAPADAQGASDARVADDAQVANDAGAENELEAGVDAGDRGDACTSTCDAGDTRCVGNTIERCTGSCSAWVFDADCAARGEVCEGEPAACASAPRCDDSMRNGDETDVDCGGSCSACTIDRLCAAASDCETSYCVGGRCSACPVGQHDCTGTCVDDLSTASCGRNCFECPAGVGERATCEMPAGTGPWSARCGAECMDGYLRCDGRCAACPAPTRDGAHVCRASECVNACAPGFIECASAAGTCCAAPIDDVREAEQVALAVGADGVPQISARYYNPNLYYAHRTGGSWTSAHAEYYFGVGSLGTATSIALNGAGRPRIAHTTITGGLHDLRTTLRVTRLDDSGWTGEAIETTTAESAGSIALTIDDAGREHICYTRWNDSRAQELRYAVRSATGWSLESTGAYARACDLELDGAGVLYMAYADSAGVHVARRVAGAWSHELVEAGGRDPRLARAPSGSIHLVYEAANRVRTAVRGASLWSASTVAERDEPGTIAALPDIAIDPSGARHIVYRDRTGWLRYATGGGPAWTVQMLEWSRTNTPRIIADEAGVVHVAAIVNVDSRSQVGTLRYWRP